VLPPDLAQALVSLLHQVAGMTVKIKQYDQAIKELTRTAYPGTQALIRVYGVGHLTALTFVLMLGKKERFRRSRDVSCIQTHGGKATCVATQAKNKASALVWEA
jgi:transposase